jgi:RNA-binding protein
MHEVGEVLHVAGSGRIIIQLNGDADEGHILCDRGGTKIAKVMELIGPLTRPYASARPLTNNLRNIVGKKLFALGAESERRRRR